MQPWLRCLILAAGFTSLNPGSVMADPSGYRLGALDKLRINVSEWSASHNEFRSHIDGNFSVGPSGRISLPIVGEIPAAGSDLTALAKTISEQFQTRLGVIQPPTTSVEIIEYRPFYILGLVNRPGSYPFRPGLTVLHALSIAEGLFRRTDSGSAALDRNIVTARGDLNVYSASTDELFARRARLQAELDGRETIEFPVELASRKAEAHVARLMNAEENLKKNRQDGFHNELDAQQKLKALAEQEVLSIVAQEAAQEKQRVLVAQELEEQRSLVARGLAPAPRLFPIEIRLADVEGKKRQLQADALRVRQDVLKTDQALKSLQSQRREQGLTALKETQMKLEEIGHRARTAERLASEMEVATSTRQGDGELEFSILRKDGDRLREFVVSETEAVQPGDIVRVTLRSKLQNARSEDRALPTESAAIALQAQISQ